MDEPSAAKRPSVLTIDRAAFLLLRVKRAFKKKRQQRKDKHAAAAAAAAAEALGGGRRVPPPLLRSRTLPAIVAPGFSILHAQIDPTTANDLSQSQLLSRGVSTYKVSGFRAQAPRISFTGKEEAELNDQRRKSASSRLGSSPRTSIASDERVDGIALRVPTPRGSVSSTGSSTGSRLARLLTQGVRGTPPPDDGSCDAPRRLSWERRESAGQLPRSASIDSMVEAAICARRSEPIPPITLQLPARADRALSLVSPAVGRRAKSQRGLAGDRSTPVDVDLEDILAAGSSGDASPARLSSPQPGASATAAPPSRAPTPATEQSPPAPRAAATPLPSTTAPDIIGTVDTPDLADTLEKEILDILGDDPSVKVEYGGPVHKEIASRFEHFAATGIDKELRKELTDKYLVPENCARTGAPILNDEIRAALPEALVKRDKVLQARQKQIATAISCVAYTFTEHLKATDKNHDLLKTLMDMGRILCDIQHMESVTRRNFCMNAVKKEMKDHLTNTNITTQLFGDNLSETLKTAKAVQKSGTDLQVPNKNIIKNRPHTANAQPPKNWKQPAPPRRQQVAARGRDTAQQRAPPPPVSRRSPPPPRATRRR